MVATVAVLAILYNKNIIIVYPYSHDEIPKLKMGTTRLIYEQIESLRSRDGRNKRKKAVTR
jgi:hypothetical protein